mgnify:CR=1 FL=1
MTSKKKSESSKESSNSSYNINGARRFTSDKSSGETLDGESSNDPVDNIKHTPETITDINIS